MQAIVIKNKNVVLTELKTPSLSQTQIGAIIKIFGCGLCGSDIVKLKQHPKEGLVLGHEIAGEIVDINCDVDFKIGDRIVMGHHVPCFECIYCKNENYSMCKHFKETNIFPGGFAEYIFASEEHLLNTVFKIPDNLTEIEASFMEPLACCLRAVKRTSLIENSTVVVVGLGSIGLLMGQCLKTFGHKVIGCDLIQNRLDIAKRSGFDEVILSNDTSNAAEKIMKVTKNFGADAIFMTSGAYQTIPLSLAAVRDGGKIVVFSSVYSLNGYPNNEIYYRELTIFGSYSPAPIDLKEALELIKTKKVNVKNFSTIYKFKDTANAIEDTVNNKILKAYITL